MIHAAWLLVVLTILAVARLTRLVTADTIADPVRGWIIRHRPAKGAHEAEDWVVYLVHCRWCASMWIAGPVAVAVWFWHGHAAAQIVLIALAASHATALLAGLEDD